MNKEKQTDRIIRNKLKYHTSASPEHLWGAIDAQLTEDDKKGGGFWWKAGSLVAVLLLIGVSTFLLLNGGPTDSNEGTLAVLPTATNEIPETTITSATTAFTLNTDEKEITGALVIENPISTKDAKNSVGDTGETAKTKTKQLFSKREANTSAIEFDEKRNNDKLSLKANDTGRTKEKIGASKSQTLSEKDNLDFAFSKNANYFTGLDLPSKGNIVSIEKEELDWPSLLKDPKCATFGRWLKLYFYGDLYFSPDMAFRKLESKGAEYDRYTADREATESQLFSYSTGARLSIVSNYGLAIRTGIVYSQINERFKYENESATRTTVVDVFDDDGNLIRTDTIIESGAHYKTTHNQYRMIDVPVLLGYEVNFKKLTLALNSGIYANLSSRQKGDFLSPVDLRPVTFTSDAEGKHPAFRERLNLSLYGSVACMYNLNERWQLMLEPQFRYYLDPMTLPDYMVEQKYITAGLITGLRYRF